MRFLIGLSLILMFWLFVPSAYAYPETELKECILGSRQSPIILGMPEQNLIDYCDCTLRLVIDENEEIYDAVNLCGKRHFK